MLLQVAYSGGFLVGWLTQWWISRGHDTRSRENRRVGVLLLSVEDSPAREHHEEQTARSFSVPVVPGWLTYSSVFVFLCSFYIISVPVVRVAHHWFETDLA